MNSIWMAPLVVSVVLTFLRVLQNRTVKAESEMSEDDFAMTARLFFWLGIACVVFSGGVSVLMSVFPNDTADWWIYLIFITFAVAGISFALFGIFYRVEVKGGSIKYTSPFKRMTMTFDDITRARVRVSANGSESLSVYGGSKKLFTAYSAFAGYNLFIRLIRKRGVPLEYV